MKALFLTLLFVLPAISVFSQEDPKDYHVRVTKQDGTVFEGYNETKFSNHLRPYLTTVSVSHEFKGKPVKYNGNEVKRIEFTETASDSLPMIYEAVTPQTKLPNLFNKNPKPYKEPVFLRLVYEGENVKGYAMPYTDHTMVPSETTILYTWRYYYLTKDSEIAKAYWNDVDDIIPNMKKVMKFYFREFPEFQKMVDSEEITAKMFRNNPAIVLPIMDKTYQSRTD